MLWPYLANFDISAGGRAGTLYEIDDEAMRRERQKAKELKKSRWWQNLIQRSHCYYCQLPIQRADVTMDHVVPISRGGRSTPGNLVPACKACNLQKRSLTAVEWEASRQDASTASTFVHEVGEDNQK